MAYSLARFVVVYIFSIWSLTLEQSAEVENYMASVETVTHYSHGDNIAQEAPHEIPDKKPPPEWPQSGAVEFKNIVMQYRPGLPCVLKGLSLSIQGGDKIGVVGRCVKVYDVCLM